MRPLIVAVAFVCLTFSAATAHTIHVPSHYAKIQQAIDAALTGDTVLVAPGIYEENITFNGKAITVKSAKGARVTVIKAKHFNTVVKFENFETNDAVLDGFTIRNGLAEKGGGIYCRYASPMILNNRIGWNKAKEGAGIYCDMSSPIIYNNNISFNYGDTENYGDTLKGLGVFINGGDATLLMNVISNNKVDFYNWDWGLHVKGGGICVENGRLDCRNNIISDQYISVSTFYGFASAHGGGVFCRNTEVQMINNTIVNNYMHANSFEDTGAGISWNNCTGLIRNTIIRGNTLCEQIYGSPDAAYCNIEGGFPGMENIDADPQFVDGVSSNDYHILYTSPCRDAGDNSVIVDLRDMEGDPRIAWNGIVDMGADEFYNHLYVTGDQTPGGSIEGYIIGLPGTNPVGLFIGSAVFNNPVNTMWGEFWLEPPWYLIPLLLAPDGMPADGLLVLPATVPLNPPAFYDLPLQALIGMEPDSLTNLEVLEIR